MRLIKWIFMPRIKKLEHNMMILYKNKQSLHFAGFRFDFDTMTIEKE